MTPTEFREARQKLGLDAAAMCVALGYSPRPATITDFETRKVPAPVALLMRAFLAFGLPETWP